MQQIKDLVATDISRSLFEKIQRGIALQPYRELHISANGNDATADGTQEKPFKTLPKLLEYLNVLYSNSTSAKNIGIRFLTDFTYTEHLVLHYMTRWYILFNGNGKDVTLGSASIRRSNIRFNDVNFKPQTTFTNASCIDADNHSLVVLNNCVFYEPKANVNFYLCCRYNSHMLIKGNIYLDFSENNSTVKDAFIAVYASSCTFNDGNIGLRSNITTQKFVSTTRYGEFMMDASGKINSNGFTANCKKYCASKYSTINLNGRGDSILLGNQEGVLEQDGKVY